jgi:hypothetical protein
MSTPDPEAPAPFPAGCVEEPDLPNYLRVRAEGKPLSESLWFALSYFRKYAQPRWTGPAAMMQYFDEQRRLLRCMHEQPGSEVRLALVGDLMWLRDGWDQFVSPEVLAYLNGHQAVLGNLETPISSRYAVPWLLPDYFTFNSDPALLTSFVRNDGRNTFKALATANNHSLDRGDEGLRDTLALLDRLGIAHSGVRAVRTDKAWVALEIAGHAVGFYACCWGLNDPTAARRSSLHIEIQPGLAPQVVLPPNLDRIREVLSEMDSAGMQFRIVYLHWGYEFEFYPTVEQMLLARELVRAGVDLIVGSHPHVVQPIEVCFVNGQEEVYRKQGLDLPALNATGGCLLEDSSGIPRKAMIAYSLGNFATAMFTHHCRTGLILSLHLEQTARGGRLAWHQPEIQFVYNAPRQPPFGKRRLMLLETYLRERERAGDPATAVRQLGQWLTHHLLGKSSPLHA